MVIYLNRRFSDNGIRCQDACNRSLGTRLTLAVERAFLISRLNLVYNKKQILFLNEYKSDLLIELKDLITYNKTKSLDGKVVDPESVLTDKLVLIRVAKYLIGEAEALPDDFIEVMSTYYGDSNEIFTYLRYLVMKSKSIDEQSNFFAKSKVTTIYQQGLEIQGYECYDRGVNFEYVPSAEEANLYEYASSFKCCDTISEMMSFYHHMCMLAPEIFGPSMHVVLHDIFDSNKGLSCIANVAPHTLANLLRLITALRKNNPLPLGKVAYAITERCNKLKIDAEGENAPEIAKAVEGFDLDEILSANNVELEQEVFAIALEDLSDDDTDEDSDTDDDPEDHDLEEDDDLESNDDLGEDGDDLGDGTDDDLDSDDDLGTDDDDDLGDDGDDLGDDEGSEDDEEEEEEPKKEIPKSDAEATGKKAIVISFEREHTADSYTYRSELGKHINTVLENEENDLTVDQRSMLKNIRSRYLFLWSVETINEVLEKVVGIKLKKK